MVLWTPATLLRSCSRVAVAAVAVPVLGKRAFLTCGSATHRLHNGAPLAGAVDEAWARRHGRLFRSVAPLEMARATGSRPGVPHRTPMRRRTVRRPQPINMAVTAGTRSTLAVCRLARTARQRLSCQPFRTCPRSRGLEAVAAVAGLSDPTAPTHPRSSGGRGTADGPQRRSH